MFKDAWRIFCRICIALGLLLTFFVAIELFRAFVFFHRLSPMVGWTFAGLVVVVVGGLPIYVWVVLSSYPTVLRPPPRPALEEASFKDLGAYCRYLTRYLHRLAENPNLDEAGERRARDGVADIEDVLRAHPLRGDLQRTIARSETEVIGPLLDILGEQARKEIRRSVRDVMLGVSLSPYHSVDLVVVLYRNAAMVLRIANCYASRPHTREQFLILRDVMRVVVTVNFLYIGRNLLENLFANLPLIGRVVDDIGQGLGAGLFTSAAGHAAIDRCSAFRGWDRVEAADSLAAQAKRFFVDVRDIFTRDVLPDLRGRIRSEQPEDTIAQPGFWDTVSNGISTAVDATAGFVDTLVIQPAVAGTRGVMKVGGAVTGAPTRRGRRRRKRRRSNGPRLFGTLGQRIRYRFKGPTG